MRQRPSIAAPSWQAPRVPPLMVELEELMIRAKGADWFVYCADTLEATVMKRAVMADDDVRISAW